MARYSLSQGVPVVGLANSTYYTAKFEGLAEQFAQAAGTSNWTTSLRSDPSRCHPSDWTGARNTGRCCSPLTGRWSRTTKYAESMMSLVGNVC
jgi:hypothetical protein